MGCNCNKAKLPQVPTVAKAVKGVVAITKTRLGIGLAPSPVVSMRRDTCAACEHLKTGLVRQCALCACIIEEKTIRGEELCPIGKW